MVLPTNIDSTYADSGTDASVALHQQHHDTIHGALNGAVTAVATAGTAQTLTAPSIGTAYYDLTLSASSCALTVTGGTSGYACQIRVRLRQDGTGGRAYVWPVNVAFPYQSAPAGATIANRFDVYVLTTYDGGVSFTAETVGVSMAAPSVPSQVTGLGLTTSSGHIVLTWDPAVANGAVVSNYKIYRGTSSGSETLLATVGAVLTYDDATVTNGTTYYYKVSAVNAVGEGTQSAEASLLAGGIINESFTGSNGTNLTAHTADTGQSWTADSGAITIQANAAQPTYSAGTVQRYEINAATSLLGKTLAVDIHHSATRVKVHLAFMSADGSNRLEFWIANSGSDLSLKLFKQVSGSGTVLATAGSPTVTLGATVTYTVVIPASLSNPIVIKQGSTTVISYTLTSGEQTAFSGNQHVGIGGYTDTSGGTGDDGTSTFDNLVLTA